MAIVGYIMLHIVADIRILFISFEYLRFETKSAFLWQHWLSNRQVQHFIA